MTGIPSARIHFHNLRTERTDDLRIRVKHLKEEPIHWHSCFEIELMLEGEAVHHLNGETYTMTPGDVYLLRPDDFHAVEVRAPSKVVQLMFSENVVNRRTLAQILTAGEHLSAHLPRREAADLQELLGQAMREFDDDRPARTEYLFHLLECIFILVMRRCVRTSKELPMDHPLSAVVTYLHGHFRDNPTMMDTAERFGFNASYFSDLFHKTTGQTYKDYLSDLRLNYALRLVRSTDLPVSEICFACGFNSQSNFLRAYRQQFGETPKSTRDRQPLKL
jgi:AraC-like DNA-binding protein/quercetin dioxygenase-like cupin family protein